MTHPYALIFSVLAAVLAVIVAVVARRKREPANWMYPHAGIKRSAYAQYIETIRPDETI